MRLAFLMSSWCAGEAGVSPAQQEVSVSRPVSGIPEALHLSRSDQDAGVTQTPKRAVPRQNTRQRPRLQVWCVYGCVMLAMSLYMCVIITCVCFVGKNGSGFSRWVRWRTAQRFVTMSRVLHITSYWTCGPLLKIYSPTSTFPTTRCAHTHSHIHTKTRN